MDVDLSALPQKELERRYREARRAWRRGVHPRWEREREFCDRYVRLFAADYGTEGSDIVLDFDAAFDGSAQ